MARYYIICDDVESAWKRVYNVFPIQTTTNKYCLDFTEPAKYCLDFTDKQFIFVTQDNVYMITMTSDPCYFYRCYNPTYYSSSEENMNKMIDWIRDKIKGIYEEEKKDIMNILGQPMVKLDFPTVMWIVPIKKVIFNNPATIVFWEDGTKTVVKAKGEDYDPEKGLAMAIAKNAFGNEGNYYNEFKKWLPKDN